MAETKTYGAIDVPAGGNDEFDEKNTYYLNESRFNWNKFLRAAFPVLIAVVIMGGFAYGMSHGFNHFYGPPKGNDDDAKTKSSESSWIPESPKSKSSGNYACSAHEKCSGLTGDCCPSDKGVMLECCK